MLGKRDLALTPGRVYVIAEAGVNHNGCLELAMQMVDVAADAGADAIKFQAFKAEALADPRAEKVTYQKQRTGADGTQQDMLRACQLPPEAFRQLAERAHIRGLGFICTPFDMEHVDLLDSLDITAFKVASGEITNHPLLKRIAEKRRSVIMSCGMASLGEIEDALDVLRGGGAPQVILLHCTSGYPAPPDQVNLRVMESLRTAFQVPVGYSDHTLGTELAIAASALGAAVIEKHFTLDKTMLGPDHAMSLNPSELRSMISGIRKVQVAVGTPVKRVAPCEAETRMLVRRSVYAARDIGAGEEITEDMLTYKRPGVGIPPSMLRLLVGRRSRRSIKAGEMLLWSDV